MKAHGISRPHLLEHVPVQAAGAEVILGVHFDPIDGRIALEEFAVVAGAQPDARAQVVRRFQLFFPCSLASLPGSPCARLPPIFSQVPAFTILKSFGS